MGSWQDGDVAGSGGVGSGGRGEAGSGSASDSGLTGVGGAGELNANGDCVIADTVPDGTSGTGCKAAYDDLASKGCEFEGEWTGSCGGYLIFAVFDQLAWFTCYYDASTRRLVATRYCIDVDIYCGGAYCVWQGPEVGGCYLQIEHGVGLLTQLCPRPDAAAISDRG